MSIEESKKTIFSISEEEKELTKNLLKKITETEKKEKFSVVDFASLYTFLDKEEISFAEKLLTLNPLEYGFKGEYLGIQDVPKDLVEITGQKFEADNEEGFEEIGERYLPKKAYDAYIRMNGAMLEEIKKELLVGSGYRSPAYQLFLLVWYLNLYDFDIEKTVKRVAVPGYSEHCVADSVAIDFITKDGVPQEHDEKRFEDTDEYKWLLENARDFGFNESYPLNNEEGVMYEPWHWRFVEN